MTLVKCPHCSRAYPPLEGEWRGWSVDLTTNTAHGPSGANIKLEGQEAVILAVLIAENGGVVSRERLYVAVWGRWTHDVYDALRTRVTELRKKIRPHGLEIINSARVGYAISTQQEQAA